MFTTLLKLLALLMVLDVLRTYARAAWDLVRGWDLPPLARVAFVGLTTAGAACAVWFLGARV